MNWVGAIVWMIGEKLYKDYRKEKIIKKLKSGKVDDTEWIYGKIPTKCDLCTKTLDRGSYITGDGKGIVQTDPKRTVFITGWDESIFRVLCPDCCEKLGGELRDVKVYNLKTLKVASDEDTPETRKKSQRFQKLMGWR